MLFDQLFDRILDEWNYLQSHDEDISKIAFHEVLEEVKPIFTILSNNENLEKYHVHFSIKEKRELETEYKKLSVGIQYQLKAQKDNHYECTFIATSDKRLQFSFFLAYFFIEFKERSFDSALKKTLNYLKKQWSLSNLNEHFQLGLFGELYILEIFIKNFGWEKSLDFWKGPDSGLHDFEIDNSLIEVKTTLTDPPIVKIVKPEQLFKPESRKLFLNVCIVSKGIGLNIVEFVNELTKNYPIDDIMLSVFEDKLTKIGYFNHLLSPDLLKVKVESSDYVEISDSNMTFPKKMYDSLPKSIKNVQYHLDFAQLNSYPTNINDWV